MNKTAANAGPKLAKGAALRAWVRALDAIKIMQDAPATVLPGLLDTWAETFGEAPALLGDGTTLTYRDLAQRANRVARWAKSEQLGTGQTVCLFMPNAPDYVAIWLGLTRAGCTVALVNTNLVEDALLHSIHIADARVIIVGGALVAPLRAVADRLGTATRIWVHGRTVDDDAAHDSAAGDRAAGDWPGLSMALSAHEGRSLTEAECALPAPHDRALLIYTSGTTGAPKAANITHRRIVEWSFWFAGMMDTRADDRMYNCLPLYHSVGGIVAIGALLIHGGSVLIRPRFSASRFWDEVVEARCTLFQYIGELCRFLVNAPPHPLERAHQLRLACGNGLQGDVWTLFQPRFGIPQILEFYAATEGSVSLYNCEGKPGAIGRVPAFLAHRFPVALIRCDAETGEPVRTEGGLCIACATDEVGEALGLIDGSAPGPARAFDGYTDASAAARKILYDVFLPGDRWFRTGDLMRKDAAGYFYFVDRMGDTFRWKGENVATTEVAAVLRAAPGVMDAVVYGVTVPGHEGRAGMAAITTAAPFDFTALRAHLSTQLPPYAQPLFVRCCRSLDATGTFKFTKRTLAQEGYADTMEPVWFNDRDAGAFVLCDADVRAAIGSGTKRL
jgi:fatty-acyl-CoA synthase